MVPPCRRRLRAGARRLDVTLRLVEALDQPHQDRQGDENGRVRADDDAHVPGEGELADGPVPKMLIARVTKNTVAEVRMVRDSVSLIDALTTRSSFLSR